MSSYMLNFFLILPVIFCTCEFPRDPRDTFNKVNNNKLKAGYSESKPMVIDSLNRPEGIEPWIIRQLAEGLNSEIRWIKNSESELMNLLKKGELHLVICGLTDNSLFKSEVGFTKPYYISPDNKKYVIAVPPGENKWLLYIDNFLFSERNKIHSYIRNSNYENSKGI